MKQALFLKSALRALGKTTKFMFIKSGTKNLESLGSLLHNRLSIPTSVPIYLKSLTDREDPNFCMHLKSQSVPICGDMI